MMKLILLLACILFAACYDGSGTNCERYDVWMDKAQCFRDYAKNLEHRIEILELEMKYGCNELKRRNKNDIR